MKKIKKLISLFLAGAVLAGVMCTGSVTAAADTKSDFKVTSKTADDGSYCIQITTSSFFTIDLTAYRLTDHVITAEYFCENNTYKFTLDYIGRFPYPVFHINDEFCTDKTDFDYNWDTTWVDGTAINSDIFVYAKTEEHKDELKTCSSVRITCSDKKNSRVVLEDVTIPLKENSDKDSSDSEADSTSEKNIADLKISDLSNYTYTGKNRKAKVIVKDGDYTLVKDTDYTLTYKNCKNIGTASVTIKGIGDYTGEKTLTYKILPKKAELSAVKTGDTSVKFNWNKVSGAEKYEIYVSKNGGKYKKLATISAPKTSLTLTGFNFEKYKYQFRIRAVAEDEGENYYGSFSKSVMVKK